MSFERLAGFACSVVCVVIAMPGHAAGKAPVFETDIAPILVTKCGKCHSSKVQKGALDLSSMHGLRAGGESGESAI